MSIVKFGDIVREVKLNVDRDNNPYEFYVAGEHMDTEDLTIRCKGLFATDDVGPAFTRIFKKGQILYGSRRTYLKKVAVADFDGICSNTTFVLESKNEHVFCQKLLPFIMLTDSFTKWSISHSKGSTNPYILFSDLANYAFELPSLDEQRVLADKLWAAYEVKESYKNLLARTDKLLHAQFEKMFGDPFSQNSTHRVKLQELCTLNPRRSQTYSPDLVVSFFPMEEVREDGRYTEFSTRPYSKVCKGFTFAEDGDVIFAKITPCMENGKGTILRNLSNHIGFGSTEFHVLRPKDNICTSEWLYVLTSLPRFREEAAKMMSGTGGQKRVPLSFLADFLVNVPDIKQQEHFATIFHQNEKTKELLRKGIEAIEAVIRSLIAEGTTKV